jgi:hypothetical protein
VSKYEAVDYVVASKEMSLSSQIEEFSQPFCLLEGFYAYGLSLDRIPLLREQVFLHLDRLSYAKQL